MQNLTPPWKAVCLDLVRVLPGSNSNGMLFCVQPWVENLTGTRGAYKPYNTAAPKVYPWEPKTKSRS